MGKRFIKRSCGILFFFIGILLLNTISLHSYANDKYILEEQDVLELSVEKDISDDCHIKLLPTLDATLPWQDLTIIRQASLCSDNIGTCQTRHKQLYTYRLYILYHQLRSYLS